MTDVGSERVRAPLDRLGRFCKAVLRGVGADDATADATTRAMMHGSRLGVDSHGVRLLDHYVKALEGGRVSRAPVLHLAASSGAVATLDAGHAQGALAAYTGMTHAITLAEEHGIGAVAIRNTSHFGPAGAYAMAAAEFGFIGLATCNSDSFVRLHDGASRFHGTNPLAVAVPIEGHKPWLLDMATSAITYNRVQLQKSLGAALPQGVASTAAGEDTEEPGLAEMLVPLGHAFGFKGAGMAGLVEILSAVLSGMRISPDILPMSGPDFSTPREMGAFVLAMKRDAFIPLEDFDRGMRHYLDTLRASPARQGGAVMAPGDREWVEEARRIAEGVPIDPETERAFRRLAARFHLDLPFGKEAAC